MSKLDAPIFKDDEAARRHLEAMRWPNGPVCPKCGTMGEATLMEGKSHRPGLYKCRACEAPFTVTMGTVFESSHVPLHKWFIAVYMLCCSKKGCSSKQLERMLGVTYKTAWFMSHRIREAMRDGTLGPLGGEGQTIEADETYFGPPKQEFRDGRWHGKQGIGGKIPIVTLIERDGRARTVKFDSLNKKALEAHLAANADKKSHLRTDESRLYSRIGTEFASHETVNHSVKEYVRGDAYTNTAEGYFSIFKRGMKGIYQHCGQQHLQRYLTEFDFRFNHREALEIGDMERTDAALAGSVGKRLYYRQPK